ncbi:MAG: CPBP family intramembrane metalloprotease [Acholeplasmatales bacterium]|nr:CPBP family intramembrane metalloprotease [Acholeplasmatales bacterium]
MNEQSNFDIPTEQTEKVIIVSEEELKKEKSRSILAIIFYLATLFVAASFIAYAIGYILCQKYELDMLTFVEGLAATDFTEYDPMYLKVSALCQGWANLLSYLLGAVAVCIILYKALIIDFKKIKERPLYFLAYVAICGIAFLVITTVAGILLGFIIDDSVNQATIEMIMTNGGAPTMIVSVVLLAPILEELVYRKAIFNLLRKYGKPACYAVSIILFTLPHMISTDMSNMLIWLIQCVPYALSGFLLCYIYDRSNENIYTSIAVHMLNNILACILIFV